MSRNVTFFFFLSAVLFAAEVQPVEQVLIPLRGGVVPGAHGSLWTTELLVHNQSDEPATRHICPGWIGGFPSTIPARVTQTFVPSNSYLPPVFACVDEELVFNLRVRDLSRQALTWGTEIPVIRKADLLEEVALPGVPTDSRFRQTLRVYNWLHDDALSYSIQALSPEGAVLLDRALVPQQIRLYPGYAEIIDIVAQHPELSAHEIITLRIAPNVPDLGIWAFVSITNNETQHVTLITPD
jgi:hypothetical protein